MEGIYSIDLPDIAVYWGFEPLNRNFEYLIVQNVKTKLLLTMQNKFKAPKLLDLRSKKLFTM